MLIGEFDKSDLVHISEKTRIGGFIFVKKERFPVSQLRRALWICLKDSFISSTFTGKLKIS